MIVLMNRFLIVTLACIAAIPWAALAGDPVPKPAPNPAEMLRLMIRFQDDLRVIYQNLGANKPKGFDMPWPKDMPLASDIEEAERRGHLDDIPAETVANMKRISQLREQKVRAMYDLYAKYQKLGINFGNLKELGFDYTLPTSHQARPGNDAFFTDMRTGKKISLDEFIAQNPLRPTLIPRPIADPASFYVSNYSHAYPAVRQTPPWITSPTLYMQSTYFMQTSPVQPILTGPQFPGAGSGPVRLR